MVFEMGIFANSWVSTHKKEKKYNVFFFNNHMYKI